MTPGDIAKRLFSAAEQRAKAQKYRIGHGAQSDIRNMTEQAAPELLRYADFSGAPIESLVRNNEIVIRALIDEMVAAVRAIPGYLDKNPGVVGEETLAVARSRFCPCWPFC